MLQLFPGKVQAWIATTGLTLAIGAAIGSAATLTWEHRTPFGLGAKVERAETHLAAREGDLRQARADLKATVAETWRWSGAYNRLTEARAEDARVSAGRLTELTTASAARCRAAFDSGYSAGRALTGGPDHEPSPQSDRDLGAGPGGGVRDDFAASWRSGAVGARPGG